MKLKQKQRAILIGQIIFIITIGFIVDKIIPNPKPLYAEIIPYESQITINNTYNTANIIRGNYIRPLRNAEDVWANQDGKFLEAEDRYTNKELAEMILDGEIEKANRIIEIDKYDYDKIKPLVEQIKKERIIANNNKKNIEKTYVGGQEIIQAKPHETFKSYMAWTTLSPKYAQGQLSAKASPDPETAIMKYDGRYLVALGFAYADYIGQKIDVVMENGSTIPIMVGDFKAIEHTDENQSSTLHDGSIIEFIVSSNKEAAEIVKNTGNYNTIFPGKVKEFRKIKEV